METDKEITAIKHHILKGHNTGLYHRKLAVVLERNKRYYAAIHFCKLIVKGVIVFCANGMGRSEDWYKRIERMVRRISKAKDRQGDTIFSEKELGEILRIQDEIKKEELERKRAFENRPTMKESEEEMLEDFKRVLYGNFNS